MTSTPRARARSFDSAAALYAAYRPGYPDGLFDAVEELTGRPLDGARVADVGAGTGIATGPLHARGARVVAVEPGDGMAAEFRRAHPRIPLVRGDGDRLPLVTGGFDLLTYAQAWHWTDPARSVPEARRVLRPGGALAIWWNDIDASVGWVADQDARLRALFDDPADGVGFRTLPQGIGSGFTTRTVAWSRRIPLDDHLANLASHSAFLLLGEPGTSAFLRAERARLAPLFPDGTVEEPYVVSLHVAVP
ncbi:MULTISPECIES: class I SAM-dependent methyltransferase [unclassified Streptomyces]|uniref:class I SAM-dependent methyltransferase n=1 Tax=unclassified Streptomyces TaxID=2593676 RepID=UPI002258E71C|nr:MULTISPECIES: class I SAM-dependent methyltransferase [unclassified Streptomyces]MCX4525360.1 class I SAM-dependent methyltransferase [Streptomyces sp. NBC_01551]MCX4544167.1 class I SAM-dependent methyltransferase [Streptomyces sp. NBC_01565]